MPKGTKGDGRARRVRVLERRRAVRRDVPAVAARHRLLAATLVRMCAGSERAVARERGVLVGRRAVRHAHAALAACHGPAATENLSVNKYAELVAVGAAVGQCELALLV